MDGFLVSMLNTLTILEHHAQEAIAAGRVYGAGARRIMRSGQLHQQGLKPLTCASRVSITTLKAGCFTTGTATTTRPQDDISAAIQSDLAAD